MLTSVRRTLGDREMMRAIFTLAWPTVLEQALSTLVQYADTAQVGVLGAQASAAIGLTTTVMWLLYGPMGAAGMSVLSCISMSLGAKDGERAQKAASQGVILALSVGGVLMVLTLAISPFLPLQVRLEDVHSVEDEEHMKLRVALKITIYSFLYHIRRFYTPNNN